MTRAEAETKLAEQALVALPAIEQPDENVPVGSVISWSVPDDATLGVGGEVLPDTPVQLVVSTGPAPRTIPTLVGTTVERGDGRAAGDPARGHAWPNRSSATTSRRAASCRRTRRTGRAASRAARAVTITPSKGVDLVTAPTLVGLNLQQARDTLLAAGLQLGSVLGNTQGTIVEARVAGELMAAGGQYRRGTAVDIALF